MFNDYLEHPSRNHKTKPSHKVITIYCTFEKIPDTIYVTSSEAVKLSQFLRGNSTMGPLSIIVNVLGLILEPLVGGATAKQ